MINVATIQSRLGQQLPHHRDRQRQRSPQPGAAAACRCPDCPIQIVEERTIGPSLGQQNIDSGMEAIGWAMLVIVLFMGIYYRAFGWWPIWR